MNLPDPRALTILALGPDDFPACLKASEEEIARAGIFFELVQG